jgi:hypothetical protein
MGFKQLNSAIRMQSSGLPDGAESAIKELRKQRNPGRRDRDFNNFKIVLPIYDTWMGPKQSRERICGVCHLKQP